MAVSRLGNLATRAPVPVFAVAGIGARTALLGLRAHGRVELVASPRHATVLLVGGAVTEPLVETLAHVHDQVPEPRAVVWWGGEDAASLGISGTVTVATTGHVVDVLVDVHRELLSGRRRSTPPVGPASNPVSWRGEGPHGQGGEGMMGGQPYGRAMAMTGPDVRDGLQLDRVTLPVGPALPGLPPGLRLELEVQGDVIQQVELAPNPFASGVVGGSVLPSVTDPFDAATTAPVAVAGLELARARYHLLRLSAALDLYGLDAVARRVARLASGLDPSDGARLERLRRWLRRTGSLWGASAGVGRVDADTAHRIGLSGTAARAAGRPTDARSDDATYRSAGFEVLTRAGGDAHDRWLLRIEEASQALRLATAVGQATVEPDTRVEDPRRDAATLLEHLPRWLTGLEWGDAITTIASLDLDLEAAANRPRATAAGHG